METVSKIRRANFIQGKSIKQICRELRVSRNTVRRVLRSGVTGFSYDRSTQPRTKIDPWRSDLDEMMSENAQLPKRQRLTLVRMYEELRNRGYYAAMMWCAGMRPVGRRRRAKRQPVPMYL